MHYFTQGATIPIVPSEWRTTLNQVQAFFPSAQIAGGCLRDLYHQKPAKDVDIFIPLSMEAVNPDTFTDDVENILANIDPYFERIAASIYGQSGDIFVPANPIQPPPGFRNIFAIYRLNIDNVVFECIFIEDRGEDIITVFDLSIAQIGWDGKNDIRATQNFIDTVKTGVIKVCNINRSDRQVKRMARILAKYPEYRAEDNEVEF